jgi:hypothetical protein
MYTAAYSSTYQIHKNAFLLEYAICSFIYISFQASKLIPDYYISVQAAFGPGILSSMYGE